MPQQNLPAHRPSVLLLWAALLLMAGAGGAQAQLAEPTPKPTPPPACERRITAKVVAINQVITFNRLGAVNPHGLMYALERDVEISDPAKGGMVAGNVKLRADKRPRPLVLRMNAGDCLIINFRNLITPDVGDNPLTPTASVHVAGLQLVNSILDDGSNVGENPSSLVPVNGSATYTYFAEREGNHLLYSTAATTGGEGDGGTLGHGLFGSVNVQARGARWYRSQVTAKELAYATKKKADGTPQTNPAGQPVIDYEATYPANHPKFANKPVLNMLDGMEIFHSDLNAIITGPNRGNFPAGTYPPVNNISYNREQPFREFTVIYHDETKAVQAFPQFNEEKADNTPNPLAHTLHGVRDAFGINYGIGGIGSEIIANRLGIGPMANCNDCLYEEFFLSAWTVGDPAMIVDRPASSQVDKNGDKIPGSLPATRAFYPDDPSNVHHSYLNDHVKMRVVHAGPKEHHVHHLHAHQWLRTPDSDKSSYLDSQALGPGYAFTTEIAHGGSGNLNKTVGDSIFHCHFYPHFAQGMWELWRTHDVFEAGTEIGPDGRPTGTSRRLPDAEIGAGTPIPAIVPVPTIAMAPMPSPTFQGYPFYIAGVIGHRPPKPPLDTVDDGGLPRHVITGGVVSHHKTHDPAFSFAKARLDFDKHLETAAAVLVPEAGTDAEKAAMAFHAVRNRPSVTPEGAAATFVTNGLPAVAGAPYADPCVNDAGLAATTRMRTYKGAYIQLDITLNKAGWHTPQSRIATLWGDVRPTLGGQRAPEPLFFRANSGDCVVYHHTNLVPRVYVQDDFQVRTPTDVMGQHIHLVKFDVTSSDGSGNGWNYEDGTFSPEEVVDRIRAIRKYNGCTGRDSGDTRDGTFTCPVARKHPTLGLAGKDEDGNGVDDWLGAQTTVQRWYVDKTLNMNGNDRTLRTVFTHDHFGPSTHQQSGLYAGLVVEPNGSKWRDPESGTYFGGAGVAPRFDGGPTSWKADIITSNNAFSYREFLLEFSDFQIAYKKGGGVDANGHPVADPDNAINPPAKDEPGLPVLVQKAAVCPGSNFAPPCPEAVSADDIGTMSVNYRNEPIPLRLTDQYNNLAPGEAGDLAHVYRSLTNRANPDLNTQPGFYPPLSGDIRPGDPYTPLLRAYEDDQVQIRILVGAHEEGHNFGVHGIKWKYEPSEEESGYRNNQMMGISEHYEFIVPKLPKNFQGNTADYLYQPGVSADDQWNGLWGLMRVYRAPTGLQRLPNNPTGGQSMANPGDFNGVCPKVAQLRPYNVTATTARQALPQQSLVYNNREDFGGKLHDPSAIIFFRSEDLDAYGKIKAGVPVEPLILRARAGECIEVNLTNKLPNVTPFDPPGFNTMPMIVDGFNANDVKPSNEVGLHAQGVFFDVTRSNGVNVGDNPISTVKPGQTLKYQWYAGDVVTNANNVGQWRAIEFGATGLSSADPIKHSNKGAVGALIIEPAWSNWTEDRWSRASATVTNADSTASFREFVMVVQNDVNLRFNSTPGTTVLDLGQAVPNLAEQEDAEDSGQKAINYRTEPLWKRMGFDPDTPLSGGDDPRTPTRDYDFTSSLSNSQIGGLDPVTPVFWATAGQQVRMRLVQPGGHARNNVFMLHGHIWEEEPYSGSSTVIGSNPRSNWIGSQYGVGPGSHFDLLPKNGAGGKFGVAGDYLYRTFVSPQFSGGIWGIFRVCEPGTICQPVQLVRPIPDPYCQPCPPGMFCTDVCRVTAQDEATSQ